MRSFTFISLCMALLCTNMTANEYPLIAPVAIEIAPKIEVFKIQNTDEDNDGIADAKDSCQKTPKGTLVDASGCAIKKEEAPKESKKESAPIPEADSDGDGILDTKDRCPNTKKEFLVDGYGCPKTATLHINFAPNKADITEQVVKDVSDFAKFMTDNTGYDAVIYGHTDNSGEKSANKSLSQKRAQAIKDVLIRYGVKATRLSAIGKGDTEPVATNTTPEGKAQNRRIEIELIN